MGLRRCTILPYHHLFSEKNPGIPCGGWNSHFLLSLSGPRYHHSKLLSFAFDFVHAQTPLSILTSGAQKWAGAHSSPIHLLALLSSKMLSFDLCSLERKENKRLKHWQSSASTKSDCFLFVLMVLPVNEPFDLPPAWVLLHLLIQTEPHWQMRSTKAHSSHIPRINVKLVCAVWQKTYTCSQLEDIRHTSKCSKINSKFFRKLFPSLKT